MQPFPEVWLLFVEFGYSFFFLSGNLEGTLFFACLKFFLLTTCTYERRNENVSMEIHIIFIETRLVTFTKNTTQVGQYENCG